MSRQTRIEYENAIYHVMNRGRGRAVIFHDQTFNVMFLQCLQEASQQFGLEILAYCLMGNHYHLLLRTPLANLGRCMRHINGVYTQRYNKLKKTDGSLFRGRYKAILVEADNYLLQVSRYIHRNPIETKTPLVKSLADYVASSYPAYINEVSTPTWLNRDFVLSAQSAGKKYQAYKRFVEEEQVATLHDFYNKPHQAAVLGSPEFVAKVKQFATGDNPEIPKHQLHERQTLSRVIDTVAHYFKLTTADILFATRGAGKKNIPRQIAMYLCKQHTASTLIEIASLFHVKHYSTISKTITRLRDELKSNPKDAKTVNILSQDLTP